MIRPLPVALIGVVLAAIGCGGDFTEPPSQRKPPPPFKLTVSFTAERQNGDCLFVLAAQATDSTTTVQYDWNVDPFNSVLPGVGAMKGGAAGSFRGRYEQRWEWERQSEMILKVGWWFDGGGITIEDVQRKTC